MSDRIKVFPLFRTLRLVTPPDGSVTFIELDVPGFAGTPVRSEGLHIESCTITGGAPGSSPVKWNLQLISGLDRDHERQPVDLVSGGITALGPVRHAEYTTLTELLVHGRLVLKFENNAGFSGAQTVTVTAVLVARTYGS